MLNGLRIAMLANPVTAFAVGLTAVMTAIQVATKETKTLDEQIADLDKRIADAQETGMIEVVDGVQVALTEEHLNLLLKERDALIQLKDDADTAGDSFGSFNQSLTDFKQQVTDSIQIVKTFAETVQGQLTAAFRKCFDFTSKEFLDFQQLATNVARAVLNELINVFIVQKLVGMISTSIGNIGGAIEYNKLTDNDTLFQSNNEGGGFTGYGVRAGGIDGKGGFPAILHPNETVIDHTKGQGMGTTVNFNISTVDASGFDQLLASRKGLITSIINNAMNNQGKMGVV